MTNREHKRIWRDVADKYLTPREKRDRRHRMYAGVYMADCLYEYHREYWNDLYRQKAFEVFRVSTKTFENYMLWRDHTDESRALSALLIAEIGVKGFNELLKNVILVPLPGEKGETTAPDGKERVSRLRNRFQCLSDWTITYEPDAIYKGQCSINADTKCATIYAPGDIHDLDDYFFHEILHIAFRAAHTHGHEESFVQDVCKSLRAAQKNKPSKNKGK